MVIIFIASLFVNILVFAPIAKKCEFRMKSVVMMIIWGTVMTGIAVNLLPNKNMIKVFLFEFLFAFVFMALIGVYRFYRDPDRKILNVKNAILSPADGFIRYIKYDTNEVIIGITLTYLDVHINRSPVAGEITSVKYAGEGFLSLKYEKGIKENRRVEMTIDNKVFKINLTLIASRLVRKILVWVKQGQTVKQGDKIGKIVFGSQTDMVIPKLPGLNLKIKEKEQVYAGLTVIADYKTD